MTEPYTPTTEEVTGLLHKHLKIYEENERRERERHERDEVISKLLDGIGLLGGAPQW